MFSKITETFSACSKHITPPRVLFVATPLAITVLVIGILGLTSYLSIPPTIAFVATVSGMGLTLIMIIALMALCRQPNPNP